VTPYVELFRACVRKAFEVGASDVHIEPHRSGVDVRFRVFGDMQLPWRKLANHHAQSFIQAVKKETRLAIGVSGRAQDSRCTVPGVPVDLRVSLLPMLYGEKIVLRLLDMSRDFGLEGLGLPDGTKQDLLGALSYRNGVVLISGPTGSGKTTTLYSLLNSVDRTRHNVITLEDPVEYTLAGVNQVRIDAKVSFAQALRAVLRQDPDVILVGEIRDEETAKLAFKAAATGHLVLSTLHANGAAEVVGRLQGLGIEKETLKENLRLSAAQRLLGKLCPNCSIVVPESKQVALVGETGNFRNRCVEGCCACQSGITGRVPAIEYMTRGEIARYCDDLVNQKKKTLKEAALEFARQGTVDLREVENIA
jgi:type II secretory ATPase GspE/PulE/Tfp pilus assembly ATPase PilB-like protein